jgi:8-oxo-dGTP pyrophosphatase MutT (NUDIX family)
MKTAIGGLFLQNYDNVQKEILIVGRKDGFWLFPGGTREKGESDEACLEREVREGLSGTRIKVGKYYRSFLSVSPRGGPIIRVKMYFANLDSVLGLPSGEIRGLAWTSRPESFNLIDAGWEIVRRLRGEDYL